jgi:hypothetical protein
MKPAERQQLVQPMSEPKHELAVLERLEAENVEMRDHLAWAAKVIEDILKAVIEVADNGYVVPDEIAAFIKRWAR